ncbi:MAG: bacteriohemerythrin [Rhodospirillaceae bacterium]
MTNESADTLHPIMEWNDRLLIGHPDIDREHKLLFSIAQRLNGSIEFDKRESFIGEVLCALADYSQEHFSHEELLMQKIKYPNCAEHVVKHWQFIQKLSGLIDHYERGSLDIILEIRAFVSEWLADHISREDMEFGEFYKSHPHDLMKIKYESVS